MAEFTRALRINNLKKIKHLLEDPTFNIESIDTEKVIIKAVETHNSILLKLLLKDGRFQPDINNNYLISLASEKGFPKIVKRLLKDPRIDPSANNNEAFRLAAARGKVRVVELLLADPRVDPGAENNEAFNLAVQNQHIKVVELLLADPRVDPNANDIGLIAIATADNQLDMVELLLNDGRLDPGVNNNNAINIAVGNGYFKIFELLFADPRVDPSANINFAIRTAAEEGYSHIVKILLTSPLVDPGVDDNYPIIMASLYNNKMMLNMLLADPRVDPGDVGPYIIRDAPVLFAIQGDSKRCLKRLLKSPLVGSAFYDPEFLETAREILEEARRNQNFRAEGIAECIEIVEKDIEKYPNYAVRRHTIEIEKQILELKFKLLYLEEELNSSLETYDLLYTGPDRPNNIYEDMLTVSINHTNLYMNRIKKEISLLRENQIKFHQENS